MTDTSKDLLKIYNSTKNLQETLNRLYDDLYNAEKVSQLLTKLKTPNYPSIVGVLKRHLALDKHPEDVQKTIELYENFEDIQRMVQEVADLRDDITVLYNNISDKKII